MAVAPRPNRWPAHATTAVALGLAFWLFVAALTGWVLALERGQSLQQARDTASTLATALEENTARNFESVNLALENMVRLLQQPAGRHDPAVRELLQAQLPRLPAVRALFVVGPDGFIQHDTDYPKTPDVSLADRDYFRQHQQHPALVESISSPLQSRSGAGWFVAVSRRIGTDAEFKGILVAAVQLESLAALYRRLELGQGQVVTLFHRDGRLLARYPPNDEAIGRSFSELPLFRQQLPAGPAGTYSNDGPPLSYPRLISYRALERAPLVVAISLQQAAILAPWRRAAQGAVIALAGLMALVIAGTWLYIQRQQQREQALKEQQAAREAQALARAHAKFRTFFEQGCFFACVMTPDGDVVEANHTGLLACGLSRDEVLGRKFWDGGWWPSPAEVQAIQAGFAQAAAGHPFRTETALRRGAPADTTIELTLSPALDPAGRVLFVAALGMDVTARKRQEQQLRQLAEELSRIDTLRSQFLATLSHELRNLLSPVSTALKVLERGAAPAETAERARAIMQRQLVHMARLIDDLLDTARVNSGKLQLDKRPVDVRQLLGNAVDAVLPAIEAAGHTLTRSWDAATPLWAEVDTTRMQQVLTNLLNNAVKYSPAPGHIELKACREGNQLVVQVIDNGLGIPADDLARIFDMFAQVGGHAAHAQGGLGIGLSLVQKLVELHGGRVSACSAGEGRGSTFSIILPLMEEPAVAAGSVR